MIRIRNTCLINQIRCNHRLQTNNNKDGTLLRECSHQSSISKRNIRFRCQCTIRCKTWGMANMKSNNLFSLFSTSFIYRDSHRYNIPINIINSSSISSHLLSHSHPNNSWSTTTNKSNHHLNLHSRNKSSSHQLSQLLK